MKPNFIGLAKHHQKRLSLGIIAVTLTIFAFGPLSLKTAQASGALTTVKDTLSTSRPSVSTTASAITSGDTTLTVGSTTGILAGDTITICTSAVSCAATETKVVSAIIDGTHLSLTAGTGASYGSTPGIFFKSTAIHTISFTTRSAVSGGKFIIYIPADATPNNAIPAASGFDFNSITLSDLSLTGGTAGTISTSTASSNLIFTIPFTGTIGATANATITIGSTLKLLSPIKSNSAGSADTYTVQVDETDSSSNVIDTTTVRVATIEPVTVSATVTPSLTFTINAVNATSSTAIGGAALDATSTATTVPFGNLTAATNRTVAQYIHIDTNSNSGYIVTAQSDGQLRKTNGATIADFSTTAADNNAVSGFGYSLQDKTNTPSVFHYNDSGTFFSKGYSSSSPTTIMSNVAAASGDEAYVIYRVRVSATQAQGSYQNVITYVATAIY
jgi:hypothetical protein